MSRSARIANLPVALGACRNEEEVKSTFCSAFGFKLVARQRIDLYTPQIIFEFKFQRDLSRAANRASVVAQILYYVRRLKYGNSDLSVPVYLAGIDHNQGFFAEVAEFSDLIDDVNSRYDWDRAASTPCPVLVADVSESSANKSIKIHDFGVDEDFENFHRKLDHLLQDDLELDFSSIQKKTINQHNFESSFSIWEKEFGPYVKDVTRVSEFFLMDIDVAGTELLPSGEVAFHIGDNTWKRKQLPARQYEDFWKTYEKVSDFRELASIRQRMDRLTAEQTRRRQGEFFTPIEFAEKALRYVERAVGPNWWERNYRLWDMAAGTGNLEFELPVEALRYTYISTLLPEDVAYCRTLFPTSTVFTYDFLNDLHGSSALSDELGGMRAGNQLPTQLLTDLQNPEIKWIVLINPPFATANVGSRSDRNLKQDVSFTAVRELMMQEGLTETSRELFSQFIWRITQEFRGKSLTLGLFSKLKYLTAPNDQGLRDSVFRASYKDGFVFPSRAFHGNKGSFPVGFLTWDFSESKRVEDQVIEVDIFDIELEKIGRKRLEVVEEGVAKLTDWVPRFRNSKTLPPLSSGLTPATSRRDVRDRVTEDFLFSMMAKGNDFGNQNYTALLSGPQVSAGSFSVTPQNFEKALLAHTARRLPVATWENDRDEFFAPNSEPSDLFFADAVLWSAFSNSNETASLTGVEYQGKKYDLRNQLFPFLLDEVAQWDISVLAVKNSLRGDRADRFLARWLQNRELSEEGSALLSAARELYQAFYLNLSRLPFPIFRIDHWDVGWIQVVRPMSEAGVELGLLEALKARRSELGQKLLPGLWDLGILRSRSKYFDAE